MTQMIETPQDERAKVESWRLHVLMEAGFSLPIAEKLAHSEADLHRAVEMVRSGCDHETAARIPFNGVTRAERPVKLVSRKMREHFSR